MSNVTAYGICYNLDESPYWYRWGEYEFRFSSPSHMRKFVEQITVKRDWLNDSLSRRWKLNVSADVVAVLNLYRQVETRGYLIIDAMGREYRKPEEFTVRFGVENA